MDCGDRRVGLAASEVDLELARQQLRNRAAHPVANEGACVGRWIKDLVLGDACPWVGGDIADGIAAGLARRQTAAAQHLQHVGHLVERNEVNLDVLPGGDVSLAQRREGLADVGEAIQLLRGDATHRQLNSVHVYVGLTLPVHALPQAVEHELDFIAFLLPKRCRFGLKIIQFVFPDRDHVLRYHGRRVGHSFAPVQSVQVSV